MKPVPNLSRAVSLLVQFERRESGYHDSLGAYYAPSECYADLNRGRPRRWHRVRKHVEGVTGLKWKQFVKACEARVAHKWWFRHGPCLGVPTPF